MFKVPEKNRLLSTGLATTPLHGNNGTFVFKQGFVTLRCLASDGGGWEHVSVSLNVKRCPDWEEMCFVKDQFWDAEDCVVQYHPPKSENVSYHPYCLHLWRKVGSEFERPPYILVGPKVKENL